MSDPDSYEGAIDRRTFLSGAGVSLAAVAGCASTADYHIESVGDSEYVVDASLNVMQDWTMEIAEITVHLQQPETGEQISGVALLSPEGEQDYGVNVPSGHNRATVDARPVKAGEFELLLVHGGGVNKFGKYSSLNGGNVIERVTLVIARG